MGILKTEEELFESLAIALAARQLVFSRESLQFEFGGEVNSSEETAMFEEARSTFFMWLREFLQNER